jgi:hypothetical protein
VSSTLTASARHPQVEGLKKKLTKDSEMHKTENTRIMMENVALIKEINELRRECKLLKVSRINIAYPSFIFYLCGVLDMNPDREDALLGK